MTATGWTGEGPDTGPALPLAAQLLANRERGPGDTLAMAQARGRAAEARELREEAAAAADPDERAANLIGRGVTPGGITQLGQRLADVEAEVQAERAKIEKGERVTARVRGMLERGQIGGLAAAQMMDGDFGDAHRAEQLERQCDRLRRQLADAQAMIAPQQERELDPLEAASRHAHRVFVDVTRQRMAEARSGRREPRPFASGARGYAVRSEAVTCPECIAQGATAEESFLIHHDADLAPYPPGAVITTEARSEAGRGPMIYR